MSTPRYQHVRFFALEVSEDFFLGAHRYYKSGFLLGRAVLDGRAIAVFPWKKVRSARPFGKPVICTAGVDNVAIGRQDTDNCGIGYPALISYAGAENRLHGVRTEPVAGEETPIV